MANLHDDAFSEEKTVAKHAGAQICKPIFEDLTTKERAMCEE